MSKLFYTDPLKVAWMEKEFGLKWFRRGEEYFEGRQEDMCVHPDSYGLFEPKVDDVLEHSYMDFLSEEIRRQVGIACVDACRDVDVYEQGIELQSCCSLENVKIIQRDNKAFFSPEVE